MQRRTTYLLWSAGALLALVIFFTLALPALLRWVLVSQLAKNLHRPAAVESVSVNPFTLCLTVRGVTIREPGSDTVFVSFDLLRVNAQIVSVFEGGIDLSEVALVKPYVRLVRSTANGYNFSDLIEQKGKEPVPEAEPTGPVLFSVANIRITGGCIDFQDRPKNSRHRISDIELGLPLISNFKHKADIFVQPLLSATVNGKPFSLAGQTKPFADSLETTLDITIADFNIAKLLPYAPVKLNFKMPAGDLSTQLTVQYVQHAKKDTDLQVKGRVTIDGLDITTPEGMPILRLPRLAVSGIACTVNRRELLIDSVSAEGLSISLAREKDGSISLQKLAGEAPAAEPPPASTQAATALPWSVTLNRLSLTGGTVEFDDRLPAQPAKFLLDKINISLSRFSTAPGTRAEADLSCRINSQSTLGLQGSFSIAPLQAALSLDLAGLDITPCRNYLPESLRLSITGGILSVKGALDYRKDNETAPVIGWQGDISLENFAAARAGDAEDLLSFSALELQSIRAATSPAALDIKTIRLAGLRLKPVVEPDGTINFAGLTAAPAEPPAAAPEESPLPGIHIGAILIEKGRVQFLDTSIKPRYSADLADIQARISGLSTRPGARADLRLSAKLNRYAPFKITGTISPLQEKLDADIKVLFDNIDLSPFSPYSGKFIGRVIEKGRLSLDLAYTIQDNHVAAQNRVFIDQFTLGKSVASKDATSLPVGLAISLLKDRKGGIHLDLPVSGSLDDPSFSVGGVVLQTLVNLMEKAAVSPFALVGALLPAGMDISAAAFVCGTAELSDETQKKLDALAGLLAEKPDLSLEIQATAHAGSELEGLRQERVMGKLRALKFKSLSMKEREGLTPDTVVITSNEYEEYLWRAYKAEKFDKPETMLGLPRRLPPEEMKRLMVEHTAVNADDMKELLQQRGLAVKQYLNETAGVPAERIFIIDPVVAEGEGDAGCGVAFRLK